MYSLLSNLYSVFSANVLILAIIAMILAVVSLMIDGGANRRKFARWDRIRKQRIDAKKDHAYHYKKRRK